MLTAKQLTFLRKELETAQNPLFFHDGDADGLCSYLLLYRKYREGRNYIVKATPQLDIRFAEQVERYNPDKIFILDIPMVDQEFINKAKRPIFWIDHHAPQKRKNVHYFNPRLSDPNAYIPTTRMAYQIIRDPSIPHDPKQIWIAMAGCLADYHMPDFADEFIKLYPHLLKDQVDISTATFKRPVGKLVKLFFFMLKGQSKDVRKGVNIITRIENPDEILKQTTSRGKFLWKRFQLIYGKYKLLLTDARRSVTRSSILAFTYSEAHWSFTADLSNELIARYPKKIVIVGRLKSGSYKCSLRARFEILPSFERAIEGIDGARGGGHPNACGAVIPEDYWDIFLDNFKKEIKLSKASIKKQKKVKKIKKPKSTKTEDTK